MVRRIANVIPKRHVPINSDHDIIRDAELVISLFHLPYLFCIKKNSLGITNAIFLFLYYFKIPFLSITPV